ncbi:SDR family NAD(P)-dependent oxidoreductase [Mycolicibacterium septicum]|uniref:SDR family NAD(P)-dependent oxidoreductase n=1 Tax=Mycolicibacterium septicum TaxID=98668 RepID=UPI002361106D|nr:SDR family oxidoreductase [Mycolicibacterium septicum]
MDLGLQGMRALISGASDGIGLATAELLAEEGADVALVARRADALNEACTSISARTGVKAVSVAADLSDKAVFDSVVTNVVDELGGLDILINNAGASSFGGFGDLTDEQWVADINLKLFGFIRMTRAALPHLLKNGNGRIVNVAGNSGKQALEYHMPGAAANAAILNFSKSLSLQVGAQGVMINTVCPGPVRTARLVKQFATNAKDWGCTPEEAEERYLENLPLSYIPSARDIAYSIVFLASPRAAYLNGTTITNDGGITRAV